MKQRMERLETVIIGSGPGGYVAAIRASQLGKKVTLIESHEIGGTCLNVGCIPSKTLLNIGHKLKDIKSNENFGIAIQDYSFDFSKAQKYKDQRVIKKLRLGINQLLLKNNVNIIKGRAKFNSENTIIIDEDSHENEFTFETAIIATGSSPINLSCLPDSKRIFTSSAALNIEVLPKSMIVVGGGYIGSELSEAFACFGVKVTLIEGTESILPNTSHEFSNPVRSNFKKLGIDIYTNSKVMSGEEKENGVCLKVLDNEQIVEIIADVVLVAVGRKPNSTNLGLNNAKVNILKSGHIAINDKHQTSNPNIYAIGDVVEGLSLAHKASLEGKFVAEIITGRHISNRSNFIPSVIYTSPEIASVGVQWNDDLKDKYEYADFPMQANSLASAYGKTEGFIRVVFERNTRIIKGAQILGQQAGELISHMTTVCEQKMTVESLSQTTFPHPSYSESVGDVLEVALGFPIHI